MIRRLQSRAVVRDANEENRGPSPLELFFDLTCVVAVSRAAETLEHELVAGHVRIGVLGFAAAFFGVWWAWMNFPWFASAHDSDDIAFRLLALVQMAGVLVYAAGVGRAVYDGDYVVVTVGYGIMRVGLVANWLRVARDVPELRVRALRYAKGITALQVLWFARLALPDDLAFGGFVVLAIGELLVPMWAERAGSDPVFHPGHIEERYGDFTIIVLGESVLSSTIGFETAVDRAGLTAGLLAVGTSGLLLAFAAWWLYFDHPGHVPPSPATAFRWGYAHVLVFASLAATGAGIRVAAESFVEHVDVRIASLSVAIPTAGYLAGLGLLILVTGVLPGDRTVYLKFVAAVIAVIVGLVPNVTVSVLGCAIVMTALTIRMIVSDREDARAGP
jgi:low temperature requirement protein LtrA